MSHIIGRGHVTVHDSLGDAKTPCCRAPCLKVNPLGKLAGSRRRHVRVRPQKRFPDPGRYLRPLPPAGKFRRPLQYALVKPNVFFMLDLLETAAEPNRRRLLQLLGRGETSVNELAENFPVSRSAISQHLKMLADVGLVQARKDGRRRLYSLNPQGMTRLRDSLESFWNTELDQLAADAAVAQSSQLAPHPKENSDDH